jgi:hypothetical protein
LPLPPLFEILPGLNCSFSLTDNTAKAVSLWFIIRLPSDNPTHFVTIGDIPFVFVGLEIHVENSVIAHIESRSWMLLYVSIEPSGKSSIGLDGRFLYTTHSSAPMRQFLFGRKFCSAH